MKRDGKRTRYRIHILEHRNGCRNFLEESLDRLDIALRIELANPQHVITQLETRLFVHTTGPSGQGRAS
jgi:hypothetical protein